MENDNLKYTRDLNPWTGIGFGRPFARILVLPDINFGQKDYFAHNSILWLWANIGHVGFFIFLMLIALPEVIDFPDRSPAKKISAFSLPTM